MSYTVLNKEFQAVDVKLHDTYEEAAKRAAECADARPAHAPFHIVQLVGKAHIVPASVVVERAERTAAAPKPKS